MGHAVIGRSPTISSN